MFSLVSTKVLAMRNITLYSVFTPTGINTTLGMLQLQREDKSQQGGSLLLLRRCPFKTKTNRADKIVGPVRDFYFPCVKIKIN